jgi:heat-inducible transcriptional repressor
MNRRNSTPTPRNVEVLHSIVKNYIDTGEPVASRTISRQRREVLSPASIRNIMADLSDEGYLSQPHTSAGRIPTAKAFESYVRSLDVGRFLAAEIQRMREELGRAESIEGRIERSSHMLTEITRSIGIAAAIPTSGQTLEHIELVLLADRRVLAVVVTRDQMVRNRVVILDEPVTQEQLFEVRNYLNDHFRGWMLVNVQRELARILEQESAAYNAILKHLSDLYDRGMLDVGTTPEVHLEGTANLIGLDLHLTRERLRDLFRTLEEKKRILQILDRFLESTGELSVQVGLEDVHPSLQSLSLIGVALSLPTGVSARIAVLGPMRMNYERVISAVMHMSRAFEAVEECQ